MKRQLLVLLALMLLAVPAFAGGDKVKYDEDGWPLAIERSYFGYRFFLEGSYGMGMNIKTHPFCVQLNKPLRYFTAGTIHGFQLGRVLYVGGGADYMQLTGEAVDKEQPYRAITAFGDLRLNFGGTFGGYLDLRPGGAYLWGAKRWCFYSGVGIGFDIARSFQLGLQLNLLPLNLGTERATPMDALIGIHAGLSFGHGCRK